VYSNDRNNESFLNSIGKYNKEANGWLVSVKKSKKVQSKIDKINNDIFFKTIKPGKKSGKKYFRAKSGNKYDKTEYGYNASDEDGSESDDFEPSSDSELESESEDEILCKKFNLKTYLNDSDESSSSDESDKSSSDSDFPKAISPRNHKSELKKMNNNRQRRERFIKKL
jgi:hypothetical protein